MAPSGTTAPSDLQSRDRKGVVLNVQQLVSIAQAGFQVLALALRGEIPWDRLLLRPRRSLFGDRQKTFKLPCRRATVCLPELRVLKREDARPSHNYFKRQRAPWA